MMLNQKISFNNILFIVLLWANLSLALDNNNNNNNNNNNKINSYAGEFVDENYEEQLPWWYEAQEEMPAETYIAVKKLEP